MDVSKELMRNKFKNDCTYQDISRGITENRQDLKKIHFFLKQMVTGKLIACMNKDNKNFERLNCNVQDSWDFHNGLHVDKSSTFTLNLAMELPFDMNNLKIETMSDDSKYVKIKVIDTRKINTFWSSFIDNDTWDKSEFHKWIKQLLNEAIKNYPCKSDGFHIMKCKHHTFKLRCNEQFPAYTFALDNEDWQINFNLSPQFSFSNIPTQKGKTTFSSENVAFEAVMPYLHNTFVYDYNDLWKVEFYHNDTQLMFENAQLKPIIRMIKKLRDDQFWFIKDSSIKTLFVKEMKNIEFVYEKASRTSIFIYVSIQFYLQEDYMRFTSPIAL
uniref:Mab-21-like nucleotidyltransferase domain-containing protein n=1 Tax=Trichogramma kaykai TaxID=54128 RepID=A0ABD2WUR9_9HYME